MQNINYCQFCDEKNKSRIVDVLGKKLKVKGYICSTDGIHYRQKPEKMKMQMTVCPTSFCPAGCKFCIAKNTKQHSCIDPIEFKRVMLLLKEEDILGGVKFSGGEPFYDVGLLNELVNILFDVFGNDLEISISTNGIGLDRLDKIEMLPHVETIHISRHHYNDEINRKIFGYEVPTTEELISAVDSITYKDLFVMNCMLLKDYINSTQEVHKMLDYVISLKIPKAAFMMCTPINDYCKDQMIPFEDVINENDKSLLFTRGYYDYEFCSCRDGIYASPSGDIVEFYGRNSKDNAPSYCRGFVFDSDNHLYSGFGGEIII